MMKYLKANSMYIAVIFLALIAFLVVSLGAGCEKSEIKLGGTSNNVKIIKGYNFNGKYLKDTNQKVYSIASKWINYLDKDNKWVSINTAFKETPESFEMIDAPFELIAPKNSADTVSYILDNRWDIYNKSIISESPFIMDITPINITSVVGTIEYGEMFGKDTNYIIYKDAYDTADLIYLVDFDTVPLFRKLIRFNEPPISDISLSFNVCFSDEPTIDGNVLNKENKINTKKQIVNKKSKNRQITFKDFSIWDSNNKKEDISVIYEKNDSCYKLTKLIPMGFFENVTFPVFTDATASFFPDREPESTSVDGIIASSPQGDWATVHDSATGNYVNMTENVIAQSSKIGANYYLTRGFMLFDTSSIPVTDVVTAASIDVWATEIADGDGGANGIINITSSTPASNTDLTTADYDQIGLTKFTSDIDITSVTINTTTTIIFNASGLAGVTPGGISKFSMRTGFDFANIAPTADNKVSLTGSELGHAPMLTVTSTAGAAPSKKLDDGLIIFE